MKNNDDEPEAYDFKVKLWIEIPVKKGQTSTDAWKTLIGEIDKRMKGMTYGIKGVKKIWYEDSCGSCDGSCSCGEEEETKSE